MRKRETFTDSRFGIEREVKPMTLFCVRARDGQSRQEMEIPDLHPRIAWELIDILTENGIEVTVYSR